MSCPAAYHSVHALALPPSKERLPEVDDQNLGWLCSGVVGADDDGALFCALEDGVLELHDVGASGELEDAGGAAAPGTLDPHLGIGGLGPEAREARPRERPARARVACVPLADRCAGDAAARWLAQRFWLG